MKYCLESFWTELQRWIYTKNIIWLVSGMHAAKLGVLNGHMDPTETVIDEGIRMANINLTGRTELALLTGSSLELSCH